MRTATIHELKQALVSLSPASLSDICLRLAKSKKENKELLTYLLFESQDEAAYILSVKNEIDAEFEEINRTNIYFAKKTIRKILRITNKYIRFTGSKQVETDLRIYFCSSLKDSGIKFRQSAALDNLYKGQLKKIDIAVESLHEDLQYDYLKAIKSL